MSTAADMVTTLETALADNAGVVEVTVDGTKVRYDRKQAIAELDQWRRRAARDKRRRPIAARINLSNSW